MISIEKVSCFNRLGSVSKQQRIAHLPPARQRLVGVAAQIRDPLLLTSKHLLGSLSGQKS